MNHRHPFLAALLLLGFIAGACAPFSGQIPTPTVAAVVVTPSAALPTETATLAPTATLPPTPTPQPGARQISLTDGAEMAYVPAGEFSMGDPAGLPNEKPAHTVFLDAYWMDRTEVTNDMYARCVQAGACPQPAATGSNAHVDYYSNPKFARYPVINIPWSSAAKYCAWAGRRLPTEAEWEKAARGTDGREFPWGNDNPSASLLNFNNPAGDTSLAGNYPKGASPYGIFDMAGNVMEWVADWYDAGYYAASPQANPTGPAVGQERVLRGGSWHSDVYAIRSSARFFLAPDSHSILVGFRCVASAP